MGNGILGEKCCLDVQPFCCAPLLLTHWNCRHVPLCHATSRHGHLHRAALEPEPSETMRTSAVGKSHPAVRMSEPFFPSELGMQMLQK